MRGPGMGSNQGFVLARSGFPSEQRHRVAVLTGVGSVSLEVERCASVCWRSIRTSTTSCWLDGTAPGRGAVNIATPDLLPHLIDEEFRPR